MSREAILQPVHAPPLRPASTPEAYAIHRAALEWSLADPIIINSAEDIKSRLNWRERFEPYEHQVKNLITFCRRLPVTLLADDVGLGKTISAGLILSELMVRKRVNKALVICPKILMPQWEEELQTKFGLDAIHCSGAELRSHLNRPTGTVITTYDSARRYFDRLAGASFDMLILDEAHKLRNLHGTQKPPQIAENMRDALSKRTFKYVLMLTATPLQNRLWDLYSLIDLLTVAKGHRNPLGDPDDFRDRFIADRQDGRRLIRGRAEEFRGILRNYMSRVRRVEANLAFPDRQVRLHRVQPTPGELEIYKAIAGPIQKLNGLAQISLAQALMSSPYALLAQIENMVKNDTLPEQLLTKVRKLVEGLGTTAKLSGLDFLIEELRKKRPKDWRLVIFTNRRETQRCISDFLTEKGISFGLIRGGQESANYRSIKDLRADPPEVNVIVSTDAGAEGVNLQSANVLMNFDLPWNPMIVEQRIGRIQRLASTHANVFVVNTILAGTVEEHVVARLMEKLQLAAHAVGDIEALLESSGMEGTDDDSDSFESQIRELVVKSLAGQDVAQATQKAEQSIARAKEIIEEEEGTLNDTLGRMDGSYKQGPKMPDLERAQPSMKVEDFVVGAFAADGGKVSLNDGGIHEVTWASRPKERFTFDEALAQPEETPYGRKPLIGHAPKLYRPGQPAFERLVQSWIDRCGHVVGDLRSNDPRLIEPAIDSWCQGIAQCLRSSYKIDERKSYFQGAIGLRVQIAVAHDSFEKLLDLKLRPEGHQHVQAQAPCTISSELVPSDIHLNLDIVLPRTVQDPDVVQFSQFYLARCEEELAAAGADHRKQKKIVDDFTPKVFPSLVGLTGLVYEVLSVRLSYTIDQQGPYESVLALIPATGQVHRAPAVDKCQVTGTDVPVDCLAVCEVTRKRVLRHLLFSSEVSGRLALKDLAKVCSVTGKRLLPDEVGVSAVTGTQVALGAMRKSPVSAKMAEISEFVPCEITGAQVFKSELVQSGFSGKWFRGDQQKASAVSGKTGHISELIHCAATNKLLHQSEAAVCAVTHQPAISEALAACEVTGKRVLPSQLAKSAASGRVVLQSLVIRSTVSGQPMLQDEAIRSKNGEICLPSEARVCTWSGSLLYPTEVRSCALTALPFLSNLLTDGQRYPAQFRVLRELLEGTRMGVDQQDAWARIAEQAAVVLGKCSIVSAVASPTEKRLAVVAEVRSWLGLKVRYAGFIFSLGDHERIKGALGIGKRDGQYWRMEKVVAYPHAASVAAG